MATISTLAVNLIARTSVFEKRMKRSRRTVTDFKKSAIGMKSKIIAAAVAIGATSLAVLKFTNAASDAQETMNLFNTVFAENAVITAKWADTFARNIGRSRTEVKKWAATLQDTFVPLGFARDKAAELSKSLVELAVDVGSFKNIASDTEVIDAFTSAIVGNHRAVRAYGVVLTNSTIEQEAYSAGIEKTFAELTELEKVQLRYNLIIKGTEDAQGDAVKTADNYANRVKKLKGKMADLKEVIGSALLPTMTKLVAFTNDKIIPMMAKLAFTFKVIIELAKSNTVKYLSLATAIVFLVPKIALAVKWLWALANSWRVAAIAETIFLSLQGPYGWAIIAAGAAIALVAIIELSNAYDRATKSASNLDAVITKSKIAEMDEKNLAILNEIARKEEAIAQLRKKKSGFASGDVQSRVIIKIENQIKVLRVKLAKGRFAALRELRRQHNAEMLAIDLAAEKKAFASLNALLGDLRNKLDDIGLTPLEAQLQKLEKIAGTISNAEMNTEFRKGIEEFKELMEDVEEKQAFFDMVKNAKNATEAIEILNDMQLRGLITTEQWISLLDSFESDALASLAKDAESLKESLKGPADKINDIRERLAEMLEQGFISTGDFDKGLAKARREIGGMGELQSGRFQEIRSEFIDVAALNAGNSETGVNKTNSLLEDTNKKLENISRELAGGSPL